MKLDKLKKRYGITGGTYQDLITKILQENSKVIQKHVIAINDDHYTKVASRFNKKTTKRFVVPDVFDKIPDSGLQLRKSAEKGQLISDTLKDDLRENLREILDLKTGVTGQAKLITQTGKKAGTINNHLINLYEKKITETFANYIKDDPNAKMPSNIKTIATTEVRSAVHDVQHEYVTELTRRNPSLQIYKKWIHNPNLSILKPRDNHAKLGRLKAIPLEQNYIFQTEKGKTVSASRPHDPSLPPEEVIGCHCDIEYQGVYIMSDDKLQQVRKSLQNMVEKARKTYEIGDRAKRADGEYEKIGQGQWKKVPKGRDEEDDKDVDAMVDDKKAMQGEMEKETVDQQAEAIAQLIEEGTLTQEDFNNMSPEEIDQLLNDEGFVNEGDPEADAKMEGKENSEDESNNAPKEYTDQDRENLLRDQADIIREDIASMMVNDDGMSEEEAWDYVNDMNHAELYDQIGGDEGLRDYDPNTYEKDVNPKSDKEDQPKNEIDDMLGELSAYGIDIDGLDDDKAIRQSYQDMLKDKKKNGKKY